MFYISNKNAKNTLKNYRIFEENISNMEQYEAIGDILSYFDVDKLTAERDFERSEKERERSEKERSLLLMISQGINIELICKVLEVTKQEVEAIQEKYIDNNPITAFLNEKTEN